MELVKGRGYKEETIGTLSAFGADILKMEDDKKGSRSSECLRGTHNAHPDCPIIIVSAHPHIPC